MTPQKTTIDWLRFRAKAEPRDILEALRPSFGDLGQHLRLAPLDRGILGFQQASAICIADMGLGRMDYGGDSQRGWVRADITGKGCSFMRELPGLETVEQLESAELRRLDIALTTWDGEVSHDLVVDAHKRGRFITRGRPPSLKQVISTDPRAGKTCYIGKRDADKFMRCYEKGFELCQKYAPQIAETITAVDGKAVEDIYRCEVEFKATSGTEIPWEVIERRDQYFAGAYPFCADVLPGIEADILMRRPEREPQMDLKAALAHCRTQFGPTLYTALRAYHGDMGAVWDKIIGDSHCDRLLAAGVLLVEHE